MAGTVFESGDDLVICQSGCNCGTQYHPTTCHYGLRNHHLQLQIFTSPYCLQYDVKMICEWRDSSCNTIISPWDAECHSPIR
ncbi:hypothetical protein NPIL_5131 [Nephila pilipes]|uniref:Uncharacterized protein n=1 Tax=Nephila pilipes TaxID=299642 RepID=A0A8X6P8L1_NEPPI|nr:hypothetical protein NPIL_5131 [Nephila pilipes]